MEKPIKCIIAEDFQSLNNIYYNLLNYEKDIEVVGRAYSGKDAYELVQATNVDIILMDIEMETPTAGIEACGKILKEYPRVKIIMLTCHEDEEIILSAYEAGSVDYVLKTGSSSEILEAIRSAYNDSSPIRSYAANTIRKKLMEFSNLKRSLINVVNILSSLTNSEIDILKLLLKGKKQKEIAQIRSVELVTVKYHVSNILHKFECKRTRDVVRLVKEAGVEKFIEN